MRRLASIFRRGFPWTPAVCKTDSDRLLGMRGSAPELQGQLSELVKINRKKLIDELSVAQVQAKMWAISTNIENHYENLTGNVIFDRFDRAPHEKQCKKTGLEKSYLNEMGSIVPPRAIGISEDSPYTSEKPLQHVRGNKDMLTSVTESKKMHPEMRLRTQETFGNLRVAVNANRANIVPNRLAIAMILNSASEEGCEIKEWNWRNDNLLRLASEDEKNHASEIMFKYGIDPNKKYYSRAEKMAVFAALMQENFIVGKTEPGAANIGSS